MHKGQQHTLHSHEQRPGPKQETTRAVSLVMRTVMAMNEGSRMQWVTSSTGVVMR